MYRLQRLGMRVAVSVSRRCGRTFSSESRYFAEAEALLLKYREQKNRSSRPIALDRCETLTRINRDFPGNGEPVFVTDSFTSVERCKKICATLKTSELQYLYLSPGERKAAVSTSEEEAEAVLGDAYPAISHLITDIDKYVDTVVRCTKHHKTPQRQGAIVSWLSSVDSCKFRSPSPSEGLAGLLRSFFFSNKKKETALELEVEECKTAPVYSRAHCDKANNAHYDISVIQYLNEDFEGGELVFLDDGHDSVLTPRG
jgi:hypothetical protein